MKHKLFFSIPMALAVAFALCSYSQEARAGWGKLTLSTGGGEEVEIKHGLFGHKTMAKDRLGDAFESSHSIFGTKTKEIAVLGNGIRYHKGILGLSDAEAHTMLGDSATSHKGFLFRTTNVNLGGINSLFGHYVRGNAPGLPNDVPMVPASQDPLPKELPSIKPPDLGLGAGQSIPNAFPDQGDLPLK
jgi:hypothetical protein